MLCQECRWSCKATGVERDGGTEGRTGRGGERRGGRGGERRGGRGEKEEEVEIKGVCTNPGLTLVTNLREQWQSTDHENNIS